MHSEIHQRNFGIDLLRLVAAFYVIILHIMFQGGLYSATTPHSYQNYLCSFLSIFAFCAVNIFGIISGYVGYRDTDKTPSLSGFLYLWISVVFYGAALCLVYKIALPDTVSWTHFITMFFPLSKNLYWYFSAYTAVYFLSPYINHILHRFSDHALRNCFFLICFFIVPLEYTGETFKMAQGYSAVWLLILYLVGAIMKKAKIGSRIPSVAAIVLLILLDLLLFYLSYRAPQTRVFIFDFSFKIDHSYITPIYLATAILHVIVFSRLRFSALLQKMISFAAPASFFVYIINVQDTFWRHYMKDHFIPWVSGSPAGIFVRIVGFSVIFVLAVVFIDYFRRKVFLMLGIPSLCRKISCVLCKDTAR